MADEAPFECEVCTYMNHGALQECEMCGKPRSGGGAGAAPSTPRVGTMSPPKTSMSGAGFQTPLRRAPSGVLQRSSSGVLARNANGQIVEVPVSPKGQQLTRTVSAASILAALSQSQDVLRQTVESLESQPVTSGTPLARKITEMRADLDSTSTAMASLKRALSSAGSGSGTSLKRTHEDSDTDVEGEEPPSKRHKPELPEWIPLDSGTVNILGAGACVPGQRVYGVCIQTRFQSYNRQQAWFFPDEEDAATYLNGMNKRTAISMPNNHFVNSYFRGAATTVTSSPVGMKVPDRMLIRLECVIVSPASISYTVEINRKKLAEQFQEHTFKNPELLDLLYAKFVTGVDLNYDWQEPNVAVLPGVSHVSQALEEAVAPSAAAAPDDADDEIQVDRPAPSAAAKGKRPAADEDVAPMDTSGPADYTPLPMAQPARLIGKQLYEYQLRALAWMKGVEERYETGYPIVPNWNPAGHASPSPFDGPSDVLRVRGGILSDQMGLGKTLTAVALILAHPKRPDAVPLNRDACMHECGATLVLCPSHLVQQWKDEIEQVTPLRVVTMSTMAQAGKVSYQKVLDSDVVIVSHAYLTNTAYKAHCGDLENIHKGKPANRRSLFVHGSETSHTIPILQHFGWHRIILDEGHEILADGKRTETPFQQIFYSFMSDYRWYITGTPFPHKQLSMQGALRYLEYFTSAFDDGSLGMTNQSIHFQALVATVKKHLFWRSTQESVALQKTIPGVVDKVLWVKLTPVERAMYNAARVRHDMLRMRQLCCHPQISAEDRNVLGDEGKTLEDIRMAMIAHNATQLQRAQKELVDTTNYLDAFDNRRVKNFNKRQEADAKRAQAGKAPTGRALQDEIDERAREEKRLDKEREKAVKDIEKAQQNLKDYTTMASFFSTLIPRATEALKEPCLVCFEEIVEAGVSKCGHVFCVVCLKTAARVQGKCPMCRAALTERDVTAVVDKDKQAKDAAATQGDDLVQKHGVKMATLIRYLRGIFNTEDEESKAIVFSQWDNMLIRIGETLSEAGISSVYCKGNVHMRNHAIQDFKRKDGPRVIMLSLDNAASGTNLTEARHVILVDPVAGTRQQAAATEGQAIGRAARMGQKHQVTVVRLLTEDTIEQEMHNARV